MWFVFTGGISLSEDFNVESIEAYRQAAEKNPHDAKSYFNLGIACLKSGMYQESIESLKQAIKIVPDDAEAHKALGYVCLNLYLYEDAIEASKQVLRIKPDATAHYNLGYIYNASDDKDSALKQYEILKSLDSELANKLLKLINK
ncbi:hypothetical protein SCALIN_C22_0166 [Candidatus Scalindua japonica]|uniref:Tetratricopeptide repeat protein n=2 Tax=Candidatus Scalindua japonica TaxID=1284222 RepID=A0A286TZZ4_9BACT|nr:hypothetical protein SCALIN_C22_0166 [Candidatus Scalindua japonica]